jgi:hypothetical protein
VTLVRVVQVPINHVIDVLSGVIIRLVSTLWPVEVIRLTLVHDMSQCRVKDPGRHARTPPFGSCKTTPSRF